MQALRFSEVTHLCAQNTTFEASEGRGANDPEYRPWEQEFAELRKDKVGIVLVPAQALEEGQQDKDSFGKIIKGSSFI